ncbi:MAG: hypothetical protein NVSMB19_10980 [Vulcanimicrobiaceae bacterium]
MVGLIAAAVLLAFAPGEPPSPAPVLREIGRVRAASPFCSAFERHFNAAARPMLASDERIGAIGFTLGTIEAHYRERGGELLLYDDRVHLMRFVGDLQKAIPQARRELDELRASAPLARDSDSAAQTLELAASLGKALDKQRQIAIDSLGVVQAMMDLNFGSNRNESHATVVRDERAPLLVDPLAHLAGIRDASGPRASTEMQSQMPGSFDRYTASTPANARDVRSYLQWQRQLDRIGDAEGAAAERAATIAGRCGGDR